MKSHTLFEEEDHRWIVLGRDPDKSEAVIDTNEYLIVSKGQAMLLDPGGVEIFPRVLMELTKHVRLQDIRVLFASHQDPDIISSLAMWLDLCPGVKTYCSWLWTGFISHFSTGADAKLTAIPDEGMRIPIGASGREVTAIPAHYCHSSGNFSIYDPCSGILFSGDIGAALLPDQQADLFVADLHSHIRFMEKFHLRWMPSTPALRAWVASVRALNPSMICPQHGGIFRGAQVGQFLDWLESLEVGQGLASMGLKKAA